MSPANPHPKGQALFPRPRIPQRQLPWEDPACQGSGLNLFYTWGSSDGRQAFQGQFPPAGHLQPAGLPRGHLLESPSHSGHGPQAPSV